MFVLILGDEQDPHVGHVLRRLQERHRSAHVLDSRWFPQQLRITFQPDRQTGTLTLPGNATVDLHDIDAVYWRTYHSVDTPRLPDREQSFLAYNDARGLFETLLNWLPARWVNGWRGWQLHQTKPVQLARVSALGVRIPETLVTNEASAVREFCSRVERVIFKPVQGGAHARRMQDDLLTPESLERLSIAPVTLQEEIEGTNIRTFVAGEDVYACKIETEAVDFRDDPQPRLTVHHLPPAQMRQCRQIAEALELVWTGIDFRMTRDGEYVFLEANPSPMFLGFEEQTGLPLTDALVNLLM